MTDLKQMEAELAEMQAKVQAERERVRGVTLDALKDMLASGTLKPEDLTALLPDAPSAPRPQRERKTQAPRYRNPDTEETWSGGGAPPKWIQGKNRDDYLIDKDEPGKS
jgi:DNA-binding protein H-NS